MTPRHCAVPPRPIRSLYSEIQYLLPIWVRTTPTSRLDVQFQTADRAIPDCASRQRFSQWNSLVHVSALAPAGGAVLRWVRSHVPERELAPQPSVGAPFKLGIPDRGRRQPDRPGRARHRDRPGRVPDDVRRVLNHRLRIACTGAQSWVRERSATPVRQRHRNVTEILARRARSRRCRSKPLAFPAEGSDGRRPCGPPAAAPARPAVFCRGYPTINAC